MKFSDLITKYKMDLKVKTKELLDKLIETAGVSILIGYKHTPCDIHGNDLNPIYRIIWIDDSKKLYLNTYVETDKIQQIACFEMTIEECIQEVALWFDMNHTITDFKGNIYIID